MSDATPAAPVVDKAEAAEAEAAAGADGDDGKEEKDLSPDFAPVVELTEVETKTGEEDERVIFKIRSKLFRFDKGMAEWKERGTGDVRLLQHKANKKIRLLMRREKTLKICLNHFVNVAAELSENVGSDRSWVFHAVDYADGQRDEAMLAIRFANPENAELFKKFYNSARDYMRALAEGKDPLPELPVQETSDEPKGEKVADAPVKANGDAAPAEAKTADPSA
jgi:Ran-binding protein 1